MKNISDLPYHPNPDGTSCGQAVYLMMLEYFYPRQDWSFEKINQICDYIPGRATWAFHPIIGLVNMGLDVCVFEVFDVPRFLEDPVLYLQNILDEDTFQFTVEYSDMEKGIEGARKYQSLMHKIDYHARLFEAKDLRRLIDEGYLVGTWVNMRKLNKQNGCEGHLILVYDYDENGFYAHDPGGRDPEFQIPNRYIPEKTLIDVSRPTVDPLVAVRKK